jgi:hypothetical protein
MITKTQIEKLHSFGIPLSYIKQMDSEIVNTVIDLNRNKFKTVQSCAGHNGNRGMVVFQSFPKGNSLKLAIKIMENNGLKRVHPEITSISHIKYMGFTGIGK